MLLEELFKHWLLTNCKSDDTEILLYGPDGEVVKIVKVKKEFNVHRSWR